ncbi:MAG: cytochrome c oxidase subunit 3 [Chitinophagaceae bacterium]
MTALTTQRQKIHPHKLLMWIAIGSIIMMFAGWTSAFMVRKAQGNWLLFTMPKAFWISTFVIVLSSITMYFAVNQFKKRKMQSYKLYFGLTALLGLAFMILQFWGFYDMHFSGITLASSSEGVSGSFIYVITFVHLLHMLGGVIAILITYLLLHFKKNTKVYSSKGLEILATYWHFVDVLWIYLFFFFLYNQKF